MKRCAGMRALKPLKSAAMPDLWNALKPDARAQLTQRDYSSKSLAERLATTGVEAGELIAADRAKLSDAWIPGVEVFGRRIYPQRHRGYFGEFARQDDGAHVREYREGLSHSPSAHSRGRHRGSVVPAALC